MRFVGLMGLLVVATLAVITSGAGAAAAAPTSSAPSTLPGLTVPDTGIPALDAIIDQLSDALGSSGTLVQSQQHIVVTAPAATDQTATLTAYERAANGSWRPVLGPTKAFLGELGMGVPADNVYRTPEGTFALDQAFGREPNPGTKMPYFTTDTQDWWDSNPASPTYNTHVRQVDSPGGDSENLYNVGPMYDYAVNIAHNPQRLPGRASAIFLHVTDGNPTMGCVAIDRDVLRNILRWLDPAKNPRITIGTNQPAPTGDPELTTLEPTTTPTTTTPTTTTPSTTTTVTVTPTTSATAAPTTTDSVRSTTATPALAMTDAERTELLNRLVELLPAAGR
ncbi:MAG: hypothetical protein QM662_04785 [Gordonia sp. (in: high G+C Gram-positive bacteria)]